MSRKYLFVTGILFFCSLYAGALFAKTPKRTFDKSVFRSFGTLQANKTAMNKSVIEVHTQFPGWSVTADKLNGLFTDIFGSPILLDGATDTDKAQNCLFQNLGTLGVNSAEWTKVSYINAPKADYVNYRQVVGGHNVVFSRLGFRFTKEGRLARMQMRNYGSPSGKVQVSLSKQAAISAAIKDLNEVSITNTAVEPDWSWFPIPSSQGYTFHPAWAFTITGRVPGGLPLILTGYVDATNGDLLYRTNKVKETGYDVTVKGVVYKNGTLLPTSSEPLTDLRLNIGIDTLYTDSIGLYSDPLALLPVTTTIPLAGKWSTVIDSPTSTVPLFTDLISATTSTYNYPTTTPCSDRHVNAYYHVNRVHNFMKGYFPTFTGMDFSLPTNIDLPTGDCNAFYSGTSINFFAADTVCHSFAEMGDVIYHEYGHGISDHFYTELTGTSIMNGALNEACSDIWALSITHNPILAANAFVHNGGFIRRYDITPQVYPIDLQGIDVHKDGQIIAGTWWDVALNLGVVDSMTKLFTDVYYDAPDGPDGLEGEVYQSILIDALMADDNNSNLSDGTPHYAQIVAAFAKHGIYLEGDATLYHPELMPQPAGVSIPVTAVLDITATTFFHDLTLYYRVNGSGAWNPVVLTNSSLSFTGTIPPQPFGTTIEYYFVVHDSLNVPNAFFPITCNPALPPHQATIPYQFGVGIASAVDFDFESPVSGWGIALNPGDDATLGLWHQDDPVPNPFYTSWPAGDHTSGAGQCLVTGAGDGAMFGTAITGGTSTVLSPVFDISSFSTPVVEYYRWFSNEQYLENFKKDPWIVKIRDASGSAWQTVENTYQADDNWRRRIFTVSQFLPATATQIQLKFFASDSILNTWVDDGQTITVGGVDDFSIYDKAAPASVKSVAPAKMEIYPNPADEQVHITLSADDNGTITLYDVKGKKMVAIPLEQSCNTYSLDTKGFPPGSYSVVVQTNGSIRSKKIVVVHK